MAASPHQAPAAPVLQHSITPRFEWEGTCRDPVFRAIIGPDMPGVYYVFETRLGWVGIAGKDGRIRRLTLPLPDKREAEKAVKEGMPEHFVETKHDFSGEADRIRAYFRGEWVDFKCEIDAAGSSAFDRRVRAAAREIGYGRVETYGWIAARIGQPGAARAVGRALGRNPVPVIVPCHRVIRSDGHVGGFSAGLEWKIRLLDMEKHVRGGSA